MSSEEDQNKFALIMEGNNYNIQIDINYLSQIKKEIANQLIITHKYFVQTHVDPRNLQLFIHYLVDNNKTPNVLELSPKEIYDYLQLIDEFQLKTSFLSPDKLSPSIKLSYLTSHYSDNSLFDEEIALNLDYYLEKHSQEMYKLDICTLYRIFNHEKRILKNQSLAYRFITKTLKQENDSNNENLFILLELLNGDELYNESPDLFIDFFTKKAEHLRYMPKKVQFF